MIVCYDILTVVVVLSFRTLCVVHSSPVILKQNLF